MIVLGISAFYHDSAAVIIKDGKIIAAAEEERFSRVKHDNSFPYQAIIFCLKQANIDVNNVDCVAYYEKPLKKFERILENFIKTYPFSWRQFAKAIPEWLKVKINVEGVIRKELNFAGRIIYVPHHLSHASAVFFTSGFEKSSVLTVDGVGEDQTTCLWIGQGDKLTLLKSINFPHSLGLFYSTFTAFLGFRVNEDEYKVMGLAAYGRPILTEKIWKLICLKEDGSFELNLKYFSFHKGLKMWNRDFEKLFGPLRERDETVSDFHKDLAASVQQVLEEVYFSMLRHLHSISPQQNVAIAGGVALNSLANGKIFSRTPFRQVHIFGPAGDSGAALGAALFAHNSLGSEFINKPIDDLFFGSEYSCAQIEEILKENNLHFKRFEMEDVFLKQLAELLNKGKIIGWFQGRMELGPRSLGGRSILAKPNPRNIKDRVNNIKFREQFRPFAGSVLEEYAAEFFELPSSQSHFPFMNFCFTVRFSKREVLAAIVHADNSCRIQTVTESQGRYHKLLKKFYEVSGLPCLLNTSFNLQGEPIVETPAQAVEDFLRSSMDFLAIGDFIVEK